MSKEAREMAKALLKVLEEPESEECPEAPTCDHCPNLAPQDYHWKDISERCQYFPKSHRANPNSYETPGSADVWCTSYYIQVNYQGERIGDFREFAQSSPTKRGYRIRKDLGFFVVEKAIPKRDCDC